jgi:hypothetical protein
MREISAFTQILWIEPWILFKDIYRKTHGLGINPQIGFPQLFFPYDRDCFLGNGISLR